MSSQLHLAALRRVHSDGNHNAFTDLAWFQGQLYLTFRSCPQGHMLYDSSRILVLRSADERDWDVVHSFGVPGRDVRDPHLLVFRERLYVYSGTWLVADGGADRRDLNEHLGYAVSSADGVTWSEPHAMAGTQGHYIWRAASHGDVAYLCGRRKKGIATNSVHPVDWGITEGALLSSEDGLSWRTAGLFRATYGNETAFLFEQDGRILALCRGRDDAVLEGRAPAQICRALAPYAEWSRTDLSLNVGGPLLARWGVWPDGSPRYLVGGRNTENPSQPTTCVYWLVDDRLEPALVLPSGGDNSYPGLAVLSDERALLSYYSSHEAADPELPYASIYLAELEIIDY